MRVVLVSGVYPPDIGGPAAQTKQVAQRLVRRGIETLVVTTIGTEEPREKAQAGDAPVHYIEIDKKSGGVQSKVLRNLQVYRELRKVLATFRPTVLHAMGLDTLALWAGGIAKFQGVPTVIKYAADTTRQSTDRRKMERSKGAMEKLGERAFRLAWPAFERMVLGVYDCVWATTALFKERLLDRFSLPSGKVWMYPNFIELQPFQKWSSRRRTGSIDPVGREKGALTLLTVARVRPWKGIDDCMRAMARLSDLPLNLRVVGDGPSAYEAELRTLAEQLGVRDRVNFAGALQHDEIATAYKEAELFVLASHYEAFGIVLVEAMASGLPVVATDVGGIPTVVDEGATALLVPAQAPEKLAVAVRTLATDEPRRVAFGEAGRERSARFGLEAGVEALVSQYAKLAAS